MVVSSNVYCDGKSLLGGSVHVALGVISVVTIVVILVPFLPGMPLATLDSAWQFALNEAVARGLIFGRDIVFTFGPYAAVETHQFHPATDALMFGGSLLIAAAFGAGLFVLADRSHWWLLPVGPLVLASTSLVDMFLLTFPLLFLLVVSRFALPPTDPMHLPWNGKRAATLVLMVAALALLPLVKGTFAIAAFAVGGLGFVLVWRSSRRLAVSGLVLFVAATFFLWGIAGQPLSALRGYFTSQMPIISGYTEAMSLKGYRSDIQIYCAVAVVLLAADYWLVGKSRRLNGVACLLGAGVTLFLAFKAGFVRHDGHATISAGAVALTGAFLGFRQTLRVALPVVGLSAAGCLAILSHYGDVSPAGSVRLLTQRIAEVPGGLTARISARGYRAVFDAQMAHIREAAPLTKRLGRADIYPVEQSILVANDFAWSPRPIFQSYSAYTPDLAERNAEHLVGPSAPDLVFFKVGAIDGRLPALEDGKSWIPLLTDYRFSAFENGFAILDRERRVTPPLQLLSEQKFALNEHVPLPSDVDIVWAEVDIRPSLLGKLLTLVFKPDPLTITVKFAGGETQDYRFVGGMGKSGFLASPLVGDVAEFVALESPRSREVLAANRVVSFVLKTSKGWQSLWQDRFVVRLMKLDIPSDPTVDQSLFNTWLSDGPETFETQSDARCFIDRINGRSVDRGAAEIGRSVLTISGWSIFSLPNGIAPDDIMIAIETRDGKRHVAKATKASRPDVNAYFKSPEMGEVGFSAMLDLENVKDAVELRIVNRHGGKLTECPLRLNISQV